MPTDSELLRQFAENRDETAFAEIVRRHADLVYSVALRVARNDAMAQDVTQAVFTKLAERAGPLSRYDTIIGWLHTAARHAAIDAIRGEARRRAREQESHLMQNTPPGPMVNWEEIGPLLDEAVGTLAEPDRKAVLLRFFMNQSHLEVGAAMGLSEDTARKRVERALEKLRAHFARHGVKTSAVLLATAISANSVQAAPAGLAKRVAPIALAGAGSTLAGGGFLATLFSLFMNTKTKTILAAAILILLALTFAIKFQSSNEQPPSPAAVEPEPPKATTIAVTQTPAQVAAPVAPPATIVMPALVPAVASDSSPTTTTTAGDPRVEIGTAMDNFVGLLESGDYVTAADTYLQLPPNISGEQVVQSMQQNPDFPNTIKMMIEATKAAQTQVPEYDETGDLATYKLTQTTDDKTMVRWKRINGMWYVDAFE